MEENKRCQHLLAQQPQCYGWLRRKYYLQSIGEKMFEKLNRRGTINTLTSKIPWERQFVILIGNWLYIYSDEASSKPKAEIDVQQFNRIEKAMELATNDVPWPFRLIKEAPLGGKQEVEYFSSTSGEEQNKWIEAISEKISAATERENLPAVEPKFWTKRPLPPAPGSVSSASSLDSTCTPSPGPAGRSRCPLELRRVPTPPSSVDDDDDSSPVPPNRRTKPSDIEPKPKTAPKPPTKAKVKLPQPDVVPQPSASDDVEEVNSDSDDDQPLYELVEEATLEQNCFWNGTAEEAQKMMKKCSKGVYLLRDSSGDGRLTLLVRNSDSVILKYPITKNEGEKRTINGLTFQNVDELLKFYHKNSFPKRTLTLTMSYKEFFTCKK